MKPKSVITALIADHFDEDYPEDYPDDSLPTVPPSTSTTKGSKAAHDLSLPDHEFSNYDDYYYYEDDDESKTRRKRAVNRAIKCNPNTGCCFCISKGSLNDTNFRNFYTFFLTDNPNMDCPKSGHAAYGDAVRVTAIDDSQPFPNMMVNASNFMAFHTILKTSKDYYEALRWARNLTAQLESMINEGLPEDEKVTVFPYSVFYVFYEQYLTMWHDTLKSLGVSLVAIFVVTFFMMGLDLVSSIISLIVIVMILTNLGGMMYWYVTFCI